MNINEMEVGKVYSFAMRSPVIYGARVEKARLTAVGDISVAKLFNPIEQQYSQIYPSLPAGTPFNAAGCKYYVFKQLNDEMIAIADQWMVEGSVEVIERIVYDVKIYDGNLGDISKIKAALAAIGKTEVVITTA